MRTVTCAYGANGAEDTVQVWAATTARLRRSLIDTDHRRPPTSVADDSRCPAGRCVDVAVDGDERAR